VSACTTNATRCRASDTGDLRLSDSRLLNVHPVPIQLNQNRDHDREAQQRRAPLGNERQRNTDHRHQPHRHADIDQHVNEQNTGDPVSIGPNKGPILPLGDHADAPEQGREPEDDGHGAKKALGLPHRAEDEIGLLFNTILAASSYCLFQSGGTRLRH